MMAKIDLSLHQLTIHTVITSTRCQLLISNEFTTMPPNAQIGSPQEIGVNCAGTYEMKYPQYVNDNCEL